MSEKAFKFFNMINPIEHSDSLEKANKYKVEPYVIAADVYGASNLIGQGGWTWYTGSSGWFYKAGIEYLLGLRIKNGNLKIEPCMPKDLGEYFIRYEYYTSVYNIHVRNVSGQDTNSVLSFKVNGEVISEKSIKLIDNGRIYEVEVEI